MRCLRIFVLMFMCVCLFVSHCIPEESCFLFSVRLYPCGVDVKEREWNCEFRGEKFYVFDIFDGGFCMMLHFCS